MPAPVSPSQQPIPPDWRFFRRVLVWVSLPVLLGAFLAASTSGWLLIGAALLLAGVVVYATKAIVAPVESSAGRVRKTTYDLEKKLVTTPLFEGPASTNSPDLLSEVEEELFRTSKRALTELQSLRELAARLEQSTTLFEGVLETMQEAVLVVDSSERVLFINSAARDLFDVSQSAAFGKLAWESIRSSGLQEIVTQALSSGKTVRGEVELPRRKRLVEVSAVVLNLAAGPGCLAVAYDVTDLRRLEKIRREFVSNVSHELKTPLTSIQAYADTLLNGALEDEGSSRLFVERIVEQSERLSMLIQDLLRLARIESEPEAFQIESCDAVQIASSSFRDHQNIAQTRQIHLVFHPPTGQLNVLADADGLRTILNNLLANAINYTLAGGRVTLSLSLEGTRVLFEVSDTGVGIAKEHQSRVFERFYRVDKARTRSVGGTGLGLSIVRHLVEVMQGEITLKSELGEGSTFRVWLPLAK